MRYVLPLLCVFASPVLAADVTIVSPIYSQLVALPTPDTFAAGSEDNRDGFYILELAPKGETMDVWTQLITLTGAKGEASLKSAGDIATEIGNSYQAVCPDTFSARTFAAPKVKGASEVYSGYLGCGDNTKGQSEAVVFVVLKGAEEIYTVQWAEHGPVQAKPMDPDLAHWQPRIGALGQARVCDKVPGEKAPYPSCTQ